MKRLVTILTMIVLAFSLSAQTVQVPTDQLFADSALYELGYNNWVQGAWVSPVKSNGNTTFEITNAFEPVLSDLVDILNAGGEVYNYMLVLKGGLSFLDANVESTLPDYQKQTSSGPAARTYSEWFLSSDIYVDGTDVYCVTVNMTGYKLKASEIRTIVNNNPGVSVLLTNDPEFIAVQ